MVVVKEISKSEVLLKFSNSVSPDQAEIVFKDMLRSGYQKITVDCSDLIHIGHQLLGKLYMFHMDLQINKRQLVLTDCSEEIRSLLHLTKIDETLQIVRKPFQGSQDSLIE